MHFPKIIRALGNLAAFALALPAVFAAPTLMQGPMLGHVDGSSAKVWARIAGEADCSILYSRSSSFGDAQETKPVRATAKNDYCVQLEIDGLEPSSFYYYQLLINGEPVDSPRESQGYPLLTAPSEDMAARFTIGFGAGAKTELDGMQAIWLQVQNARPHAFFWLGDNESSEGLAPEFQAEQIRKQRNVPFLQPLLRSIPQLATWDGELGGANSKSLEVFQRYWANPSYGSKTAPGAYFTYEYGGVDFIFLDTYSYRNASEGQLLGAEQMGWLKTKLAESKSPFKVLLSSSSWTDISEETHSTWTAFPSERNELLGFIGSAAIEGVVLISGNKSQAEVNAIPMSDAGGYDLYELVSSPLAQDPVATFDEQAPSTISIQSPYAQSMNFGLMTFDMASEDPTLSFEIINVFGESVFPALTINASELKMGIASWQNKVEDPEAYAALEDRKPETRQAEL